MVYELNATMAAFGLQYLHPAESIEEVKARVIRSYPLPDHIMRLALASSGLGSIATSPSKQAGDQAAPCCGITDPTCCFNA